jgi:ribosome-associated protein
VSDEPEHPRDRRRRERQAAGDDSARLARELMKVPPSFLDKLGLDDDVREVVDQARRVKSPNARRRAERTVAGALRQSADMDELSKRIASIVATGAADTRLFHTAETWRARLIAEGDAAAQRFPGGATEQLSALIDRARSERDTGQPRGAARALFRHVIQVLEAKPPGPAAEADQDE